MNHFDLKAALGLVSQSISQTTGIESKSNKVKSLFMTCQSSNVPTIYPSSSKLVKFWLFVENTLLKPQSNFTPFAFCNRWSTQHCISILKYRTWTVKKITSVVLHVALPVLGLIHKQTFTGNNQSCASKLTS